MAIFRLAVIIVGILFLGGSILCFVTRKISPGIGVIWVLVSILIVILGALPIWRAWGHLVSMPVTMTVFFLALSFLIGMFLLCLEVSNVLSRNRELAMQVSLLNQENEQILNDLERLKGEREG